MPSYFIATQGCRTNIADSVAIGGRLEADGYCRAATAASADLIVVNSCSVTDRADGDGRRLVRRLRRANSDAELVVTGCLAERAPELVASWAGVTKVVPNRMKARLLPILRGDAIDGSAGTLWDTPTSYPQFRASGHTRGFVKVQDGCDACCSFCIIPTTRGRSRSLPVDQVIATLAALGASGAEEVVLTGIHLGHYGRDLGTSLVELLDQVAQLHQPNRIRLTSVEPNEITPELVTRMAANERFAPHWHVPLQSGSDPVLGRMRRPYSAARYGQVIDRIHRQLPFAGIGADVIVGFPGETEADHRATVRLVQSLPLTYLHVFSYSPRQGTAAAQMDSSVPVATIQERNRELRGIGDELHRRFADRLLGRPELALILGAQPTGRQGLTGAFVKVALPTEFPVNRLVEVAIDRRIGDEVSARPLAAA